MAIDHIPYRDADNLAYPDKKFWPLRIPVSHWQLRHYISHPDPDHLYYASGHEIFCLDVATRKRELIATLPFEARCTASGYGWVCVGGEDEGHFAAIRLDGSGPRSLEVDATLPIDAWRGGSRRPPSVKVERIGEEIVNSISIHRVRDEDAHLDDIVALLTNNDKSVRVYSLPQSLETAVLRLPFAMNHATISPDGSMMVAVGDYNQAHFFARHITDTPPLIPKPHNRLTSANIDWTLVAVSELYAPGPESSLGYFSTAWSPNGQLVAVGSEGGFITVFDVDVLNDQEVDDEDAIVAVIPSSRADLPVPHVGAVRTMIFSPEPWDLLIWAEDQGRVCIGDLRTGLRSKQVLDLEPKEEGLDQIDIEDALMDASLESEAEQVLTESRRNLEELEADFLRRYRNVHDNATAVNFATEYIEARRRQRQQRQSLTNGRSRSALGASEDEVQGLTPREQQILTSLRTTRQREEARSQGQARGVNYTTPDMFAANRSSSSSSTPNSADSSARPISEILGSMQEAFPELSRTNATTSNPSSAQGFGSVNLPPVPVPGDANGWGSGRANNGQAGAASGSSGAHSRLPRRRASVVLAPSANTPAVSASPSAPIPNSTAQRARPEPATTATDERDDDDNDDNDDDDDVQNPWRTIEDAMTLARGPLFESAGRALSGSPLPATARPAQVDLEADLAERAARARYLARQRERWRGLRAEGLIPSSFRAPEAVPMATSGPSNVTVAVAPPDQPARRVQGFPEGYEALLRRRMASYGREMGVRTAGLAMSRDGSTLWAACEEGIFEFKMNRKARMFHPSVDLR